MPLMPPPQQHPLPLARAQARLAFDTLLRDRLALIAAATGASHEGTPDGRIPPEPYGSEVETLAREFADAVDRGNATRQLLRQQPIEYVDAVVLVGHTGELLVEGVDYEASPAYWQTKAGSPESAIRGRDLDGYLRTGDAKYAEQLGLGT